MTDQQCSECGKPLTDPVSRKLGIGPKCWLRKHGPSDRAPHAVIPAPKHTTDPDQISLPLEDTVDAETRKQAVDTIARHLVAAIVPPDLQAISYRDDYPALSEIDYVAVELRAVQLAGSLAPNDDAYQAAYEHLTGKPTP